MSTEYNLPSHDLDYVPVSKFATLPNKTRIHYKECGDKNNPTIILIHDLPSSSNYFRNLMPTISSNKNECLKFHVIAPDLPGFGASETLSNFQFTFDHLAETVVLLLDALYVSKFSVLCVGQYGTTVLQRLLKFKENKISAVVIQNGSFYHDSRTDATKLDLFQMFHSAPKTPYSLLKASVKDSRRGSIFDLETNGNSDLSAKEVEDYTAQNDPLHGNLPVSRTVSRVPFNDSYNDERFSRRGSAVSINSPKTFGYNLTSSESTPSSIQNSPFLSYTPFSVASGPSSALDLSGLWSQQPPVSEIPEITKLHPYSSSIENVSSSNITPSGSSNCLSATGGLINFDNFKALYQPRGYNLSTRSGLYKSANSSTLSLISVSSTFAEIEGNTEAIDPSTYTLDYSLLGRQDRSKAQASLYTDYIQRYFKASRNSASVWLRSTNIPVLVLWGTGDTFVSSEEDEDSICESYKRDVRDVCVEKFANAGHFALELALKDVVNALNRFFKQHPPELSSSFGIY